MHSSNTACFLDFDHTLFNTDEFFHVDVRNAFLHLGIDAAYWEQSYAAVWPTGYTLEKHAEEVYRRSGSKLPLDAMKRILQNSFSDLDRKSTRLNSSHGYISYAVFCLKKKTAVFCT